MKVKVRRGVFETNSSSTHTLCICTKTEYDEWCKGNMVYDEYDEELVPIDSLSEAELEEFKNGDSDQYYDVDGYHEYLCEEYESYEHTITTPNGDMMVVFGRYGYS